MASQANFQHVNYLWDDEVANKLDPVEQLVYRSNLLGTDQRITNTGGGNTSSKFWMPDPLTGEQVEVLWVKGSGGDLRTSKRENFASLYMDKLRALQSIYNQSDEKGVKTPVEDEMVGMYLHTVYNLNPRASSIDTPLHAFIPTVHVDHTHPNAVIAVAAARDGEALTAEIYGDDVGWVGWQRPGFDLGLVMEEACEKDPHMKGLVMGQHGLINWAEDGKACYDLSLQLIEKAAQYIESRDKGEQTFGGQKYQALADAEREALLLQILPRRAVGSGDSALCQQPRCAPAGRIGHLLPGSLSAHQDQAALRSVGSTTGGCRLAAPETGRGPGTVSGRLQQLLRNAQTPELPCHARP
jgi:rhamnose utilization protein RhaD (predicted bifunctional aldolase and dehydrogenase)